MRRYVPWTDFALYGGLALVSVVGSVWAALTPQEWEIGGIVVAVVVPLAFVVLAGVVIGRKMLSSPDYFAGGMAVWQNDILGIGLHAKTETAIQHFIEEFPSVARAHGFDGRIQSDALIALFRGTRCEWRGKPLSMFSRYGWSVKDKAGLQSGKSIMVQWMGSITASAWHHEVGHMVRQIILRKPIDYKHEDEEWWAAIREVKNDCKAEIETEC